MKRIPLTSRNARLTRAVKKPAPKSWIGNHLSADDYMDHWNRRKVWTHLERPKHLKRLHWCADQCRGEVFADVGCALGHSTAIMKKHRPGAWIGIDFSRKATDKGPEIFPDIPFRFAQDLTALAKLGPVDTAVCSEVIEHVEAPEILLMALTTMARRVVLTTPAIDAQDPGHMRLYTRETLEQQLRAYPTAKIEQDAEFFYVTIDREDPRED